MNVTVSPALPAGFDPTDPGLNEDHIPHEAFLELRRTAPVFWVEQAEDARAGMEGGTGYWAVSRHADVAAVSKNDHDFVTSENTAIIRFGADMTRDQIELQRVMLINQDGMEHHKTRQIISRGFTPRSITALHDTLVERAEKIVDDALAKGEGDFVEEVAAELPLQAIADLLGVPQEDRKKLFEWSNSMLAYDDPEYDVDPEAASIEILTYAMAMAEDRKANPRDDIMTKLVTAGEDDEGLSSDQLGYFVILLAVAGNETTRNLISGGMLALMEHPEQKAKALADVPGTLDTLVDEMLRYVSPVMYFRRTIVTDTELRGVTLPAGQKITVWYGAANRDEDVFADPHAFDVTRSPNEHIAFGGRGPHYCLGTALAKMEIKVMFEEMLTQTPDMRLAGEPDRLASNLINGIKHLPVKLH
jgi:cholest-4-en-3-one 26-monooxygenase